MICYHRLTLVLSLGGLIIKKNHTKTESHRKACDKNDSQRAKVAGVELQKKKVVLSMPESVPIKQSLNKLHKNETLRQLFHTAYFIALKGHAFTDVKDEIELQKLNGLAYQSVSYENETGCREFIHSISVFFL